MGFTSSESKALLVLAGLFILGLVLLQIRRANEQDFSQVKIINAEALDFLPHTIPASQKDAAGTKDEIYEPTGEQNRLKVSYLNADSIDGERGQDAGIGVKIDINTAKAELFQTLPGIGPVLADRIIQYRKEYGPFLELKDLLLVKGIGDKRFERLLPHVTIKHTGEIPDGK